MTKRELEHLDTLLKIAREDKSPLTEWEQGFVESLNDRFRDRNLSERQAVTFDKLVDAHILGDDTNN